jgi:hypothetical protein
MARARAVVLIVIAVLAASFAGPAQAVTGPLDTPSDLAAALKYEERILDHFHYGQIYEQTYRTADRITGDIASTHGENDSALYTGNYLGAEAFRYALAKRKIAQHVDTDFWVAQRNDARDRVERMVKQYHLLINISESWKTTLNPQLHDDKPLTNGRIDFGGGVFPAKKGLLFRACTPTPIDPGNEFVDLGRNPNYNRLVGPLYWPEDHKYYNCFGATSRDAYAGTTFGLLTAFDLVSGDSPPMRRMIRDDIIAMTDYTFGYAWGTPRMHGRVVLPEVEGGNDLDNFYSPLFMYTPVQQMNMAQIARHVADVAGTTQQKLKWDAVWASELATEAPNLFTDQYLNTAQPHDSYYKFHLDYLALFNLTRVEPNATVRDQFFRRALGVMDATTGDDGNALYDAFVYALSGDPARLADGVTHHRQWLDYRARLDANNNNTVNSTKCGVTIECVPKDSTEILVGGVPLVTIPEAQPSGQLRARFPLPVVDRKGQDFLWQKDPFLLDEVRNDPTWEAPAADFLLPYWMLRYYSETKPLVSSPLPAWPGPTFR